MYISHIAVSGYGIHWVVGVGATSSPDLISTLLLSCKKYFKCPRKITKSILVWFRCLTQLSPECPAYDSKQSDGMA